MNSPQESDPWVIRTDFSSDEIWDAAREQISAPQKEFGMSFYAYVNYKDDEKYRDLKPEDLVHSLPDDYPDFFCFSIDQQCVANDELPILVIGFLPSDDESFERLPRDASADDIKTFRALPSQIQAIQNNLSLANMDFESFTVALDEDGVFRGFPE